MRSTISKNHPDGPAGYLVRNRQTIKFDAVERNTHYNVYPNQLNRLKRVDNCIPSNHSPCFLKLPKMARTVWFSNPNFRFSYVNSRPLPEHADVIHFVNLCAAVFSTLFVIVFYFIVISFFSICIQIENPNFLGQPATLLPVVLGEIRAYSLKEAILTVSP